LDYESIDALIEAVKNFNGGVVAVSHDRHFVKNICTRLWQVKNKKIAMYPGDAQAYFDEVSKQSSH